MADEMGIDFPSIVFDVGGNLFSVNSAHIAGIVQLPEYTRVDKAPREIRGIMKYRDAAVTLLELRPALGMGSLEDQYEQFCKMIDDRKGDHERWVQALEETAHTGAPFKLATDPHKCALGKWRDAFKSDIAEVNFQLGRLDEPHAALHASAHKILDLWAKGDTVENKNAAMEIFHQVKAEYMPKVLDLLENLKHVFRTSVFREMVLLLNDRDNFGIIVESIHAVEHLEEICDAELLNKFVSIPCVTAVMQSEKIDGLIANIDIAQLMRELNF